MAAKKSTGPEPTLLPQELVVAAPAAVTVQAPNTEAVALEFNTQILPLWRKYLGQSIQSPEDYVQWNRDWTTFREFSSNVEKLFEQPCDEAYAAHRALTGLRGFIKSYPDQAAKMIGDEVIRYQQEAERQRLAAERAEQARQAALHAEQVRQAEAAAQAERDRLATERAAAIADIPEWEIDEATLPPAPETVTVAPVIPPPAPVRLPSMVPIVMGGPKLTDKPYGAVITDPVALLKWVLENPEERVPLVIEWRMPWLNSKCREHEKRVGFVIPGIEARRGGDSEFSQTLKK